MIKKDNFCYSFDSSACAECGGACCIGESGYIWVNFDEIEAIAKFLNLTINEFGSKYLIKVGKRYSLKEVRSKDLGYACIFFNLDKRLCEIYDVRPQQCRDFPFWKEFKNNHKELLKECPGVIIDDKK